MTYFFVLGSHPSLSLAEVYAVLGTAYKYRYLSPDILLVSGPALQPTTLIERLGGVIKIGQIIKTESKAKTDELVSIIKQLIVLPEGKFNFGLSVYGKAKLNGRILGLALKRLWQSEGKSCRLVTSREATLSSVVVTQNKLLSSGWEIVLSADADQWQIGRTLAVQPFKALSYRDYGRPARDDLSGMLPPKLAQIMINLAGLPKNEILLDPFCGSGTVLAEALLMGFTEVWGSDISAKAIASSRQNLTWLKQHYQVIGQYQLFLSAADKLQFEPASVSGIVTEPYLGPARGTIDAVKFKSELEKLYTQVLRIFYRLIKPGGRIVMIWPMLLSRQGQVSLEPFLDKWRLAKPAAIKDLPLALTKRGTLVYGRPGQKIWREIIILEK